MSLVGKLLVVALFWWSGVFGVLLGFSGTVGFIASGGLPWPVFAAAAAGVVELVVPLGLFLRRTEPWAAFILACYCLATALLFHDYWNAAHAGQVLHFYKNIALAGAFLMIAARSEAAARVSPSPIR
jgi:putative oxidoreductase